MRPITHTRTPVRTHILALLLATVPTLTLAAPSDLKELIGLATDLINPILGLLTGLAVLYFVWGIVKYMKSAGDPKSAGEGKSIMLYGILGLFVLFSFWGIVQFFYTDIFGS